MSASMSIADTITVVSLQQLPPELVARILGHVADLHPLDSLIRSWPLAYRVFESRAVDIIEAVLSSGYVCGHIRVIFRIVALIRSKSGCKRMDWPQGANLSMKPTGSLMLGRAFLAQKDLHSIVMRVSLHT